MRKHFISVRLTRVWTKRINNVQVKTLFVQFLHLSHHVFFWGFFFGCLLGFNLAGAQVHELGHGWWQPPKLLCQESFGTRISNSSRYACLGWLFLTHQIPKNYNVMNLWAGPVKLQNPQSCYHSGGLPPPLWALYTCALFSRMAPVWLPRPRTQQKSPTYWTYWQDLCGCPAKRRLGMWNPRLSLGCGLQRSLLRMINISWSIDSR